MMKGHRHPMLGPARHWQLSKIPQDQGVQKALLMLADLENIVATNRTMWPLWAQADDATNLGAGDGL